MPQKYVDYTYMCGINWLNFKFSIPEILHLVHSNIMSLRKDFAESDEVYSACREDFHYKK